MFEENLNFVGEDQYAREGEDYNGLESQGEEKKDTHDAINPNYQFYFPGIEDQLDFAYDLDFAIPDDPVPLIFNGEKGKKTHTVGFRGRAKSVSRVRGSQQTRQPVKKTREDRVTDKQWNSTVKAGLFDSSLTGNDIGFERRTVKQRMEREEKMRTYEVKYGVTKKKLGMYTKIEDMASGFTLNRHRNG